MQRARLRNGFFLGKFHYRMVAIIEKKGSTCKFCHYLNFNACNSLKLYSCQQGALKYIPTWVVLFCLPPKTPKSQPNQTNLIFYY